MIDIDPFDVPASRRRVKWMLCVFALLALVCGVGVVSLLRDVRNQPDQDNTIGALVASEELILKLTPELKKLSAAALNL
jgi:hypothetical protein